MTIDFDKMVEMFINDSVNIKVSNRNLAYLYFKSIYEAGYSRALIDIQLGPDKNQKKEK